MVISYFNYLWDIDGISAGSAIKAREFIAALQRQGHTVHLEWRTPQPKTRHALATRVKEGLKPHLQKYLREPRRLAANLPQLYREYKILKQQKPDIFFPRLEYGNFSCLLLAKMLKLPMIVEADCPPTYEWLKFYARDAFRLGDLSLKLELATLHQANAVITQSNALRDYYTGLGVAEGKIYVIPNAADINKFQPREKDPELSAKFDLKGKIVIGWLGAGVAWTGINAMIEMARTMMRQNPAVRFLMVGSPENMDFLRQHLAGEDFAGRVILPGFVPHAEIPRYLSCMDIVLAPYPKFDFFYASSMKLFEYMAAGKAIVATRIGQVAEVIQAGVNGLLFDPDLDGDLREKVSGLVASAELRQKLGANARLEAERKWNWDLAGQKMARIFEAVLRQRQVQLSTAQPIAGRKLKSKLASQPAAR